MEYVGIPSVIVICYLVAEAIKLISNNNEKLKKVIPIIVAIFGGILTGVIFLTAPSILCVNDILEAIAIGIVSGLASTGGHQIGKQLLKEASNEAQFF